MSTTVTTAQSGPLTANGTTPIPFTFQGISEAEIEVTREGEVAHPSTYTVSMDEDGTGEIIPSSSWGSDEVYIYSAPAFDQPTGFQRFGAFYPDLMNTPLDRLARQMLALKDGMGFDRQLPEADRAGRYPVWDASGKLASSSGTGNDPALRTDMAANSGFTLIKHKRSGSNTFARSAAQRVAVDLQSDEDLMNWIDPGLDDDLIADTNTTSLSTMVQNALTDLAAMAGRKRMRVAPLSFYLATGVNFAADNLMVEALGATFHSDMTTLNSMVDISGDDVTIRGARFYLSALDDDPWGINITGQRWRLLDCTMETVEGKGHYQAYIRHGADGGEMRGCRTSGSNGFFVEASNVDFLFNHFTGRTTGGDDAIAIKAIQGQTRNIKIIGNHFDHLAYFCSVGSEIGSFGANDATYAKEASDIQVIGNTGVACAGMLMVKPGAINEYDYRDGTVRGVTCSNNTLTDLTGAKFTRGIVLTPGRGARIRDVQGVNNLIRARTENTVGRRVGAIDLYIPGNSGGTAEASIEDVNLQVIFDDPFNGAANGAGVPGYPTDCFIGAELASAGLGTMARVNLDVRGNGAAGPSVIIKAGIDDAILLTKGAFTNTNALLASVSSGGFYTESIVQVGKEVTIDTLNSAARYVFSGSGIVQSQIDMITLGDVAAADDETHALWAAPRRCKVTKVEFINRLGIATHATDAVDIQINNPTAGGVFAGVHTLTAGGTAITANTLTNMTMVGANVARTFFAKDNLLTVLHDALGAGAPFTDARFRIHWAPC